MDLKSCSLPSKTCHFATDRHTNHIGTPDTSETYKHFLKALSQLPLEHNGKCDAESRKRASVFLSSTICHQNHDLSLQDKQQWWVCQVHWGLSKVGFHLEVVYKLGSPHSFFTLQFLLIDICWHHHGTLREPPIISFRPCIRTMTQTENFKPWVKPHEVLTICNDLSF